MDIARDRSLRSSLRCGADTDDLAYLLLTIVRGADVVGANGRSPARLTFIAESAFALLSRRCCS